MRILPGADGDLFVEASQSHHLGLAQLVPLLEAAGFLVRKKAANEKTLRVYLDKIGVHPLLNPRFKRSRRSPKEGLVISVLSRGDKSITGLLNGFTGTAKIRYHRIEMPARDEHIHGQFSIPLSFAQTGDIVFDDLREPLRDIQVFLRSRGMLVGNDDA